MVLNLKKSDVKQLKIAISFIFSYMVAIAVMFFLYEQSQSESEFQIIFQILTLPIWILVWITDFLELNRETISILLTGFILSFPFFVWFSLDWLEKEAKK